MSGAEHWLSRELAEDGRAGQRERDRAGGREAGGVF